MWVVQVQETPLEYFSEIMYYTPGIYFWLLGPSDPRITVYTDRKAAVCVAQYLRRRVHVRPCPLYRMPQDTWLMRQLVMDVNDAWENNPSCPVARAAYHDLLLDWGIDPQQCKDIVGLSMQFIHISNGLCRTMLKYQERQKIRQVGA